MTGQVICLAMLVILRTRRNVKISTIHNAPKWNSAEMWSSRYIYFFFLSRRLRIWGSSVILMTMCVLTNTLSWEQHVSRISQRLYPKLGLLNRISSFLPPVMLLRIYKQTILPILDYGSTVWHECGIIQTRRVEKLQNRALRIILHKGRRKCSQEMRNELKLLTLHSRRRFLRFMSIFKILYNLDCPSQLRDSFKFRHCMHNRDLRDKTLLDLPKVNSAR